MRNLKTILAQEREYEKADRERHRQVKVEAEAQEQFKMSVDREYVHPQTREQDEETPTCVTFSGQVDDYTDDLFSGCRYLH